MADKGSAPPPYGFVPDHPAPTHVVYTTTAHTAHPVMSRAMGPDSCTTTCPSCHATISTRVDKEATTKTHLFALILCLIFCPCGLIPYCTDSCKATNHYCPSCGAFLGTYDH